MTVPLFYCQEQIRKLREQLPSSRNSSQNQEELTKSGRAHKIRKSSTSYRTAIAATGIAILATGTASQVTGTAPPVTRTAQQAQVTADTATRTAFPVKESVSVTIYRTSSTRTGKTAP